ncbi:unnamed protein product, partial [Onchocerca ochengi]|uniref:SSD domain-containing protein n=1 Tax=Onchocerca ochengi TaxID=42157 RepID=A0A182EP68_ONCOC
MLLPCFLTLLLYTILCCCLSSWIYSRPWLAIGGVISVAAAVISGISLLLLLGQHITSIVYLMPFVIFSIGLDNIFISLSAWRSTSLITSFEIRMKKAFSNSSMSITVTSLTDLISFTVGCFAPFQSVRAASIWGCMQMKLGLEPNELLSTNSYGHEALSAASIWGCMQMKLGLEPNELLSTNSYGHEALSVMEEYFSDYGSYLHVWMYNLSEFNSSNRQIWMILESEIALYEYTEYTGSSDS